MLNIPVRMQVLCGLLDPMLPVYDVGCDHGYIGLWAHRHLGMQTLLIDREAHILEEFKKRWGPSYPEIKTEAIDARKRRWQNTSANVVIAGMGPEPIFQIVQAIVDGGVDSRTRLVLSPEKKSFELLMRLEETGWTTDVLDFENLHPKVKELLIPEKENIQATMGGLLLKGSDRTRAFHRLRRAQ